MRLTFLYLLLLLVSCSIYSKEKQPKQEKFSSIYKTAKLALKNQSNQEAALGALLGTLTRPELSNKQKADVFYTAALLDESLNGVENDKAYLKRTYDTTKFFNKLRDMYEHLRQCDSVDVLPDASGRIRTRFHKKTHSQRLEHRRNILGGGRFYLAKKNYSAAYPFFDFYCTYRDEEKSDTLYQTATLWATLSAFLTDNYQGTIKYADAAISFSDSATAAILQEYKVRAYASLGRDSLWVASLKEGTEKYPEHDYFFVQLADWYQGQRAFKDERLLADRLIAKTGGKAIHYYAKSKSFLSEDRYEDCIAYADSTIALESDFVDAYYNKGIAYLNMAVVAQESSCKDVKNPQYIADKQRTQSLYREARPCMEMVRRLEPERHERWAPPLYRIYLNLNLGDEFNEIDRLLNQMK